MVTPRRAFGSERRFIRLLTEAFKQRGTRAVWLSGDGAASAACRRYVEDEGGYYTDCERPFPVAFAPMAALLRQLLPLLERESPELLQEFAPELIALLPELSSQPAFKGVPSLSEIALGGTKRRLHKDSEQLFRIVLAVTSILLEARVLCVSLRMQPLVLGFGHVDAADRLTLACLLHLRKRMPAEGMRLILCDDRAATTSPWLWFDNFNASAPGAEDDLTDAYRVHDELLAQFKESVKPVEICGDATPQDHDWDVIEHEGALSAEESLLCSFLAFGCEIEEAKDIARYLGADVDQVEIGDKLTELMSDRRMRKAFRDWLNSDHKRRLHALIATHIQRTSAPGENRTLALIYHCVRSGDFKTAWTYFNDISNVGLNCTMNFEAVLFACRDLLVHTGNNPTVQAAVWETAGLTHCYLEDQGRALRAFEIAINLATIPESKAQVCFYAGLIEAKRLGNLEKGRIWFRQGQECIEGNTGESAILERGWLSNGQGFIFWQTGHTDEARRLIESSLQEIAGIHSPGPQCLNLEVNLTNNLSVLHEGLGDPASALEIWRRLGKYVALVGSRFSKSYFYRECWLLLQCGVLREAYGAALQAFEIGAADRDYFHMDIISSACGYIAAQERQYDDARHWYNYNLRLRLKLDNQWRVPDSHLALAHIALEEGDVRAALTDLAQAKSRAEAAGRNELSIPIDRLVEQLQAGNIPELNADTVYGPLRLERPKAKLTTPFVIAHLASERSYSAEAHRSLTYTDSTLSWST